MCLGPGLHGRAGPAHALQSSRSSSPSQGRLPSAGLGLPADIPFLWEGNAVSPEPPPGFTSSCWKEKLVSPCTVSVAVAPSSSRESPAAPAGAELTQARLPSPTGRSSGCGVRAPYWEGEVVRYLVCSMMPERVLTSNSLAASEKCWCLCPSPRNGDLVVLGCGLGCGPFNTPLFESLKHWVSLGKQF